MEKCVTLYGVDVHRRWGDDATLGAEFSAIGYSHLPEAWKCGDFVCLAVSYCQFINNC